MFEFIDRDRLGIVISLNDVTTDGGYEIKLFLRLYTLHNDTHVEVSDHVDNIIQDHLTAPDMICLAQKAHINLDDIGFHIF